jgi:hypothetical protein
VAAAVHVALPEPLSSAAAAVLATAGVEHVAHGAGDPVGAAATAVEAGAIALLGPFRSADVAEAVEATAPAGLPLLAPVATWAGVTHDDEPVGPDEPADHRGTVLRLVARDTEVAARLAGDVRRSGAQALVVAGEHDYGRQLDEQLALAGLPRARGASDAGVVVLCGLTGEPEIEDARAATGLPVIAFDGVQGADLGTGRAVRMALPFAPLDGAPFDHLVFGAEQARRGARLVAGALRSGARDRAEVLAAARAAGSFDDHGDPIDPPVWLWRAEAGWTLRADRPL